VETTQHIRVIVAEDDFLVAQEIQRILGKGAYDVVGVAGNGKEAVRLAAMLRPDVVLMDIKMPEEDGLSATRRIMAECPVPVVIMTAYETSDMVREASEAGVAAFLSKPPCLSEINRAIVVARARHADLMELRRLNEELTNALAEIKTLQGILPICMYCKKIRDDKGYWLQVERYIAEHSEARFSHGMCPECYEIKIRELFDDLARKKGNPGR